MIAAAMLLVSFSAVAEEPEELILGGTAVEIEEESMTGSEQSVSGESAAPSWADVILNSRGFLDEGEYVFEDDDEGHYMYVNPTIRVQIERTYEVPDKKHPFHCY